jgi:hypothetical protein
MKTLTWPQIIGRRLTRSYLTVPARCESMADVVSRVCGVQAQVPAAAELDISARVDGITRQDVREALSEKRTLVRTNGPRDTQHILPSSELAMWIASLRAAGPMRPEPRKPAFSLPEARALLEALREALDGLILSPEEIAEKMARRGGMRAYEPTFSPFAPYNDIIARAFQEGYVIYGPEQAGKTTYVRTDQWAGLQPEVDPGEAITEVCRRYISTYGPVTHGDFAKWFGIRSEAAANLFESIKGELEEVKLDRRKAWILAADAGDAWEPVEDSLRLVPQYDCYMLGSYPRPQIVPDSFKAYLSTLNRANYDGAVGVSVLLIDGVVSGMWQRKPRGKRMEIVLTPIVALTERHHELLESEISRIAAFLGTEVILTLNPQA